MSETGNEAQFRMIVEEAVKQANALAQKEKDGGLRSQATMVEKVVGAALIALVLWVGVTVQSTDKRVAVIEAKLTTATEGRYSSTDAIKDQKILMSEIDALRQRTARLEAYHEAGGR